MTVIWSYNDADPNITSGLWSPHGPDKRGATKVLFKGQNQEPDIFPPEGSYSLPLQISNVCYLNISHWFVLNHSSLSIIFFEN